MVRKGNLTLGHKYTMKDTDDVLYNYTLETYIILLTNVTAINLNKNKIKNQIFVLKNLT